MSTPPTTPSPAPPGSLQRQLRLFQTLAAVLLIALVAGAGYYLYERRLGQPVAIVVDGTPVTTVRNAVAANQALTDAEQAKAGPAYPKSSLVLLQPVHFQRVPSDAPLDTDAAAKAKLIHALKIHAHAYVILVNGKPSVGLPTAQAARDTLDRVKEHFAQMPPAAEIVKGPEFVEKVAIKRIGVDAKRLRSSASEAAPYFWTPPPSKTYVVKFGDRGGKIAARNHISLLDLIAANPGHDLNKLRPGDVLNVQKMPLLLTVRVQKKLTRDEPIVAHAPAAQAGRRRVTYLVTYTDGQETYRVPQSMEVLEKARTRLSL